MTYGDIPTECGGINRGDIPRGAAPRDGPEVDPDTRGGITHTHEGPDESIGNTICERRSRESSPKRAAKPRFATPRGVAVNYTRSV